MAVGEEELNSHIRVLTVDGLKTVIRTLNTQLHLKLRLSGNKSDFVDRIEDTLDHYKNNNAGHYQIARDVVVQISTTGVYSRPASGSGPRAPPPSIHAARPTTAATAALKPKALTWKHNPFQSIVRQISDVAVLHEARDKSLRSVLLEFRIPNDFSYQIYQSRIVPSNPVRYQLRIYAASSDFHKPHLFDDHLPIEFPVLCDLKINGSTLKTNTRGVRNQPGTAAPPDADCDKKLVIEPGASNTLEVVYRDTHKKHFVVVNLVEQYSCDQLVNMVKEQPQIPASVVLNKFRSLQDSDDVVTGSSTVSLKCPIGFFRMNTPIRSVASQSLQCFDASSFFSINEQLPTFTDPSSNKPIKFKDLAVDQFTYDILQATPADYDSVVVEPDAEWHTEDGKFGSEAWMRAKDEGRIPEFNKQPKQEDDEEKKEREKPARGKKDKSTEVLSLSSDDEDDEAFSAKKAPPPRQPQVIDLTLSSDEEDGPDNTTTTANTSFAPPLDPTDSVQEIRAPASLKRGRESEDKGEEAKRRNVEGGEGPINISSNVTSNVTSAAQSPSVVSTPPTLQNGIAGVNGDGQAQNDTRDATPRDKSQTVQPPQSEAPQSGQAAVPSRNASESATQGHAVTATQTAQQPAPQASSLPPLSLPSAQSQPHPLPPRPTTNYQPSQQYRPPSNPFSQASLPSSLQSLSQPHAPQNPFRPAFTTPYQSQPPQPAQETHQEQQQQQEMQQPRLNNLQPPPTASFPPRPRPPPQLPRPTYAKPQTAIYRSSSQRKTNGSNNYSTW